MPDDPKTSSPRLASQPSTQTPKELTKRHVLAVSAKRFFPSWKQWKQLPTILNVRERSILFSSLGIILLGILILSGWYVFTHRVEIPTQGGEYTEALIGEPQFINPLYASASDVDSDLTSLIYSGLFRWDPEEGLVNDLATNLFLSEDGLTYTVQIRNDAKFQNGEEVRARDVLFTINAIQNTNYRSPLAVSFYGVTVSQIDDKTVSFQLEEPFAPFLSTLTVGILPASVWGTISPRNAQLASSNLEPIGSGPYRFAEFSKDKNGSIRSYTLERNDSYYGQQPYIDCLIFKFYPDADSALQALENKNVEGLNYVSFDQKEEVEKNRSITLYQPTIPREIVLFFNEETHSALKKTEVRHALSLVIEKQAILEQAAKGNGVVIQAPILPGMLGYDESFIGETSSLEQAGELLDDAGYHYDDTGSYRIDPDIVLEEEEEIVTIEEGADTQEEESEEMIVETTEEKPKKMSEYKDVLHFTLVTVQSSEYINVAQMLVEQFAQIGVVIDIEVVPSENLYASVIDPRNYELLLAGVLLGIDPDPYPFWHSSQIRGGGLNLAGYANNEVDTLLEEARVMIDEEARATSYKKFQETLMADYPAVFLYQSLYSYALPTKIQGVVIENIAAPEYRFANISDWYIKTKKVLQ
ncbi:MAG: Extracellular solute-binding protein [Candidatus Uhrbacteria bacterium GW2011_GWE2_40_58]|nr:MAG: Extracellular solute-binding protein [Candidatus Uhrbacteria bacterium GW2011_GWF2_40_263]KKR67653.1 MAG: Extracellular solute-binding protein [Candidatus Uhrbacteria bacterium GW2011_GWE2_40_58]HBK34718.1 hypothetical protein [Candidatus Uhrbacteria bacterium]HCB56012.1 hypothetical protein [Candidatus Uhrbacteria bacterium]